MKSAGFIPSSTKPSPNIKGRAGTTSDLRVIYDHKLYYVTVTFDNIGDLVQDLPSPGGFGQGFIYTYYTHYKWGNNSFTPSYSRGWTIQVCICLISDGFKDLNVRNSPALLWWLGKYPSTQKQQRYNFVCPFSERRSASAGVGHKSHRDASRK